MYFLFLYGIPVGIASSAITIKGSAITARIKKYKSLIKEKKKKSKIVCLAKTKFSTTEVLISIISDEFVSVNNVLKGYDDMKAEIKNFDNK